MIDPDSVPDVELDEVVARFIFKKKQWYAKTGAPKPSLFCPYKHVDLSVNRHRDCTDDEIWEFGQGIAEFRGDDLYGRCDIAVADCTLESLNVVAKSIKDDPKGVPDNPNHADIVGFPEKKEDQMSLAQKLAAKASNRILPPGDSVA